MVKLKADWTNLYLRGTTEFPPIIDAMQTQCRRCADMSDIQRLHSGTYLQTYFSQSWLQTQLLDGHTCRCLILKTKLSNDCRLSFCEHTISSLGCVQPVFLMLADLALECFDKSKKNQPLIPLQNQGTFQIIYNACPKSASSSESQTSSSSTSTHVSPTRRASQSPTRSLPARRSLSPAKVRANCIVALL